jgi:hypothetical protein
MAVVIGNEIILRFTDGNDRINLQTMDSPTCAVVPNLKEAGIRCIYEQCRLIDYDV